MTTIEQTPVLEDFIAVYPDQNDPNIQRKINCKKEFIDMKGTRYESPPKRGEKYSHQEYFLRLTRQYDRIFLFHAAGTGKTCTMIGLAEYYADNPGEYKDIYILEKGNTTTQDMRHQIVCRCTNGKYETDKIKKATTSKTKATNITNELKKWYTITTYKTFASEIRNMSDEQIRAKFSRCHIYIDEAHTLRNVDENPRIKKSDKQKINNAEAYQMIWRVCHVAESIKLVIATATPNINTVGDSIPLLNLLLPADRQLPRHSEQGSRGRLTVGKYKPQDYDSLTYDYRFTTLEQMEPFLRGILSYVRAFDNNIVVKDMGVKMEQDISIDYVDIDEKAKPLITQNEDKTIIYYNQDIPNVEEKKFEVQTIVYPVRMSEFQTEVFMKANIEHIETKKKAKGISSRHHASEFVFPDGSYGGNLKEYLSQSEQIVFENKEPFGLAKYLIRDSNKNYHPEPALLEILRDPDLLWKHSCKFYEILRIEEANPDSKCFIYSDAVTGAGAILLALMFDQWGYTAYNHDESAFVQEYSNTKDQIQHIKDTIKPAKRYAIISNTTGSSESRITSMMDLFNSDANAHGEYIKIVIGTQVARDGINLYNVLRAYLLKAGWHPSGDLQALHRVIRTVSHEFLINEMKAQGVENPKIELQVYRMCSYTYDGITDEEEIESENVQKKIAPAKHKFVRPVINGKELFAKLQDIEEDIKIELSREIEIEDEDDEDPTKEKIVEEWANRPVSKPKIVEKKKPVLKTSPEEEIKAKSPESKIVERKKIIPIKKKAAPPSEETAIVKKVTPRRKKVTSEESKTLHKRFSSGIFLCPPDQIKSVDMEWYIKGEIKDIYNLRQIRIWKRLAIDGPNNKERNQLPTDEDYTIKADYQLAQYRYWMEDHYTPENNTDENSPISVEEIEDHIDYSTYDILYSEKDVVNICNDITQYLIAHGSITLEDIFYVWAQEYREKFIWYALDRLLSTKTQVTNRLGLPVYISSNEGTIFLQNDLPFNEDRDSNNLMYYSNIAVGVINVPIINILNKLLEPDQDAIIDSILEITNLTSDENAIDKVEGYIAQLNLTYQAKLIERVLLEYMKSDELMQAYLKSVDLPHEPFDTDSEGNVISLPETSDIVQYIYNKYSMYIYTDILEPYMDITESATTMSKKNIIPTTKKKSKSKIKFIGESNIDIAHRDGRPYEQGEAIIDEDDVVPINRVYIHTLYSTETTLVSYAATSNFINAAGKKRILKPIEKLGWRDMNVYEIEPYQNVLKKKINTKTEILSEHDIYGTILADGKFRIVNLTNKKRSTTDNRAKAKGFTCDVSKKPPLIEILIRENIMTSSVKSINMDKHPDFQGSSKEKREKKIDYLIQEKFFTSEGDAEEYKNKDLDFICRWYLSKITIPEICDIIKNRFYDTNRILET